MVGIELLHRDCRPFFSVRVVHNNYQRIVKQVECKGLRGQANTKAYSAFQACSAIGFTTCARMTCNTTSDGGW